MKTGKKRNILALEALKRGSVWRRYAVSARLTTAYGVHPGQVSQFKREIQEQASSLFATKRGPKTASMHTGQEALYAHKLGN